MILIISHKEDYTTDLVISKLNKKSIDYLRYNVEELLEQNDIDITIQDSKYETLIHGFNTFKSIWYRRVKYPNLDDIENINYRLYMLSELDFFLKNLWESLQVRWLSHPRAIYRAENKILQLSKARQVGLKIPETLVSSNKQSIIQFFRKFSGDVIVKPIFTNRFFDGSKEWLIYTNKLKQNDLEKLEDSKPLPSIYQRYIEKELELRITVVNKDVFTASVDSQSKLETSVDWRREKTKFKKFSLPKEIKQKCIQLVDNLNLSFGAIDMILNKDGDFIFLEVNPNGQWGWIEFDTGLPISDSIVKFLNQ